jgi:DNA-binding transcriptional LysR family regulator
MKSISELFVFAEVVKSKTFAEAALRLAMSPSAISKKISRLESRLEVRLFNRTTRSLSLTEAGETLFGRALHILDSIEDAENLTKDLTTTPQGTIRIASSDAFTKDVLVPFLSKFFPEYPKLKVIIVPGDGDIDMLRQRIDIAIKFSPPTYSQYVSTKIISDPWIICASPNYLNHHGIPATPQELIKHNCLTIQTHTEHSNLWQFSNSREKIELEINPQFSGIGLVVKEAALKGLGIARLAHFLVYPEIDKKLLVPVLTKFQSNDQRAIYIVYPNREYMPLKNRVFIDELKKYVSENMLHPTVIK